jgi:hypothetical protein
MSKMQKMVLKGLSLLYFSLFSLSQYSVDLTLYKRALKPDANKAQKLTWILEEIRVFFTQIDHFLSVAIIFLLVKNDETILSFCFILVFALANFIIILLGYFYSFCRRNSKTAKESRRNKKTTHLEGLSNLIFNSLYGNSIILIQFSVLQRFPTQVHPTSLNESMVQSLNEFESENNLNRRRRKKIILNRRKCNH